MVVHTDQSLDQQTVQVAHAAIESARHFLPLHSPHPSLVVLAVKDEESLLGARQMIESKGIRTRIFFESDIGAHYSAFASEPISGAARKAFSNFKLLKKGKSNENLID